MFGAVFGGIAGLLLGLADGIVMALVTSFVLHPVSDMSRYRVTMIALTKSETRGSSSTCPACGERLHSPARDDVAHARMLWCQKCKVWVDRDVIAALNLSKRGRSRFDRSRPRSGEEESRSRASVSSLQTGEEGLADEAVKGNGTRKTLILRVDASKLIRRRELKNCQNPKSLR